MKNMKKLLLTVLSMSALMISACSPGTVEESSSVTPPPAASSSSSSSSESSESSSAEVVTITLDKTAAILQVGGETETLTATVSKEGATVVWSSSNEEVATVANGVVTPVGEGYAKIVATVDDVTASCSVRVDAADQTVDPVIDDNPDLTALGHIIVASKAAEDYDWDNPTLVDLIANPNDENELMALNVQLKAEQLFYMHFGEEFRHYENLIYGGASLKFAADGENFKVLEDGTYSFYVKKQYDASIGSVWAEAVTVAPTFESYAVVFGNGDPIELEETDLDASDLKSGVSAKYTAHVPMLTAGEQIQFLGGLEKINPGDENMSEEHNGNNTVGQYPIYYVHNDAMNADVYLKVYTTGYSFWLTGYDKDAATPEVPDLPEPVDQDATYYLVGKLSGVEDWASTNYPFILNEEAEGEEYFLDSELALAVGDKIKVMSSSNAYYPEGYDTELNIAKAGTYQIYFRPAGNADWTQGGGYFFVYLIEEEVTPEPEPGPVEAAYYLKGSMNKWEEDELYLLGKDSENEHKFFIMLELMQGAQFKIYGTEGKTWYPTDAIAYKTSEGSAINKGYLKVLEDGNLAVVVPGYYFIEINTETGEGKDPGIWTKLEFDDDDKLMNYPIVVSVDGEEHEATLRNNEGKWQYDYASDEGTALIKDDVISFAWAGNNELTLELGDETTKALLELQEDKASVKVLAEEATLNFYLVLDAGTVTLFVGEVVGMQEIKATLGDYANDSAVVYVWAWKGSGQGDWYAYDAEKGGFEIPENCDHLKVVRFASGTTTPSWDATIWNQTGNLEIQEGTLTFKSFAEGFEWVVPAAE